jgi:hypothetical protein
MPVTPVESSAWLNRLNQEMWSDFWQPFLLHNNLSTWQDTVSAAAPRGWEVEIADVSIGATAPQLSGTQCAGVMLCVYAWCCGRAHMQHHPSAAPPVPCRLPGARRPRHRRADRR